MWCCSVSQEGLDVTNPGARERDRKLYFNPYEFAAPGQYLQQNKRAADMVQVFPFAQVTKLVLSLTPSCKTCSINRNISNACLYFIADDK